MMSFDRLLSLPTYDYVKKSIEQYQSWRLKRGLIYIDPRLFGIVRGRALKIFFVSQLMTCQHGFPQATLSVVLAVGETHEEMNAVLDFLCATWKQASYWWVWERQVSDWWSYSWRIFDCVLPTHRSYGLTWPAVLIHQKYLIHEDFTPLDPLKWYYM